jgi:hypothetical protein
MAELRGSNHPLLLHILKLFSFLNGLIFQILWGPATNFIRVVQSEKKDFEMAIRPSLI